VSAGLSLLLAPRVAGSRRAALSRLRARGAASGAFSGTPCSATDPFGTVAVVGRDAAEAPAGDDVSGAPVAERTTPAPVAERTTPAGDHASTTPLVPSVASDPKEDA